MAESILSLIVDTRQAVPALTKFGHAITGVSSKALQLTAALSAIAIPAGLFAHKAISEFIAFDSAMTNSISIMSNVTDKMRNEMESLVKELSTQLPISATESAKAFEYLGLAGLSAQQSMAALPIVAKFATAGNFDMSQATDQLTDALSALGLASKDPQTYLANITMLSDKLVKASTSANASISQFSTALTNEAAVTMRTYNIALSDGIALLGNYADQGIKGLEAGSLFSRGVRLMLNAAQENASAWQKMGITVKTAEGELLPFSQIAKNLEGLLNGMSTAEKSATLVTLGFQARIQQAIFPLVGMSDRLGELKNKIDNAGGSLDEVTNKQLKSMANQIKIMWNNFDNFAKSIAAKFEPVIRALTSAFSAFFKALSSANPAIKIMIGLMVGATIAVTSLVAGLATLGFAITGIAMGYASLSAKIKTVVSWFNKETAATTASTAATAAKTVAMLTLNKTMATSSKLLSYSGNAVVKASESAKMLASGWVEAKVVSTTLGSSVAKTGGIIAMFSGYIGSAASAVGGFVASIPVIGWVIAGVGVTIAAIISQWENLKIVAMPIIDQLSSAWDQVTIAITGLTGAGGGLWYLFEHTLAPVIGTVLVVALSNLRVALDVVKTAWNILSAAIRGQITVILYAFEKLFDAMSNIPKYGQKFEGLALTVKNAREEMGKGFVEDLNDIGSAFKDLGQAGIDAGDGIKRAWTGMPKNIAPKLPGDAAGATGANGATSEQAMTKMRESQFAGLALKGSTAAYQASIRQNSPDMMIEKNTKDTAKGINELVSYARRSAGTVSLGSV